jgi:DNA (cytosine-5)-methyltransferase 1
VGGTRPDDVFTIGELFAGLGGFGLAFESLAFRVEWAVDNDNFAMSTYRRNFPAVRCIEKDIKDLSVLGDALSEVDVLTAGFPCQPFSVAGHKRGLDDPRGRLFFEIGRILREFRSRRPKIVLLENVRGFLMHDRRRAFTRLRHELQSAGYWFGPENVAILNTAVHTKIPQNRERLFMVAFSSAGFDYNDFEFPEPVMEKMDVRELLDADKKAPEQYYFDTDANRYGRMFKTEIERGNPGSIYLLRRSYIRENRNGESFTLTANMGDGGHNVPVIQDEWGIRRLTPTECGRLQGMDENRFEFPIELSDTQRYKQIGNAVTVPLVAKLAARCKEHIVARRNGLLRL